MTKVSTAETCFGGKVVESVGSRREAGDTTAPLRQRDAMTASSATAARLRARTGGPREDGPKILEHIAGWTFVVVLAMLVTQLGLL
ncbi:MULTISPECIES: SCO1431 family membrane protein [unclassified Streptomyces]|uniref:SCO1431 family membrane protein n=1 Tax=unclassified Streptomyces TaxID=2593676 RepID=UPI002E7FD608|nr:SCO1431 family membrane protein [Streptomyces sp. NBC_00589]